MPYIGCPLYLRWILNILLEVEGQILRLTVPLARALINKKIWKWLWCLRLVSRVTGGIVIAIYLGARINISSHLN